jgi:type 1 glutamine amidotransferase
VALHGTNAALDVGTPNGVDSPRVFPLWADTLGSQFVAHPPIAPYLVEVTKPEHWLVAGIEPFETDDELYLSEYANRDELEALLHTTWSGNARGFVEGDWTSGSDQHLVMYLRQLGQGAVLYNTLGHCRGHYDMVPVAPYYPKIERGSWEQPAYRELLRRSLRWARGQAG